MQNCFIFLSVLLMTVMNIASVPVKRFSEVGVISTTDTTKQLKWLTLKEAEEQLKRDKKPVLIDLYTDWCGWCKVMDKNTYTNTNVIQYIQENFHPVKLDAETRETLQWRGRTFNYNPSYRANEYAVLITQGRLSFPSTVILPADGSQPQAIPGYLRVGEMELILKYFGEGHYGKTAFEQYRTDFKAKWK